MPNYAIKRDFRAYIRFKIYHPARQPLILVVRQQMNELTISMKALLQRVKDGEEIFAPENETLEALEDFQFVVKELKMAFSEQLIESLLVQPHSKDRGTYGMAKAVVVSGGLTTKGVEYLSTEQPSSFRSWFTTQIVLAIAGLILSVIIIGLLGT